ncbi:MAG: hypothetical protein D6707_01805 [Bacteroidetes bacterium]|nr:MAG: hypothetical protein D6707_01805 [Bacteroidota bacterium]
MTKEISNKKRVETFSTAMKIKKLTSFIFFFLWVCGLKAQFGALRQVGDYSPPMKPCSDIGLFAGGSYYVGELNNYHFNFALTHFAYGGVFRRYINKRWAFRISGFKSKLSGSAKYGYPAFFNDKNYAFTSTLIEGSAQFEFSFFNYIPNDENIYFTPYAFAGIGMFYFSPKSASGADLEYQSAQNGVSYNKRVVNMPFGLGVRFKPHHRFNFTLEWGVRKTFTDYIDDIGAPYTRNYQRGFMYNKDWYSLFGLIVAVRLGPEPSTCPQWQKGRNK